MRSRANHNFAFGGVFMRVAQRTNLHFAQYRSFSSISRTVEPISIIISTKRLPSQSQVQLAMTENPILQWRHVMDAHSIHPICPSLMQALYKNAEPSPPTPNLSSNRLHDPFVIRSSDLPNITLHLPIARHYQFLQWYPRARGPIIQHLFHMRR